MKQKGGGEQMNPYDEFMFSLSSAKQCSFTPAVMYFKSHLHDVYAMIWKFLCPMNKDWPIVKQSSLGQRQELQLILKISKVLGRVNS